MSLMKWARLLFSLRIKLGTHVGFEKVTGTAVLFITCNLLLLDLRRLLVHSLT